MTDAPPDDRRMIEYHQGFSLAGDVAAEMEDREEFVQSDPTLVLLIQYPLKTPHQITLVAETPDRPWDKASAACAVRDAYREIFRAPRKFGVTHGSFEGIFLERLVYQPAYKGWLVVVGT